MKKFLCSVLALVMAMGMTSLSVFAATPETVAAETVSVAEDVQERGAISGQGTTNIGSGVTSGSFTFNVSGIMDWSTAQVKLSITGFNSNDWVDAKVYRPDGTECFHIAGWTGNVLSTSNRATNWMTYSKGQRGTYTVVYSVGNWLGNRTGSGTLKCEIK